MSILIVRVPLPGSDFNSYLSDWFLESMGLKKVRLKI